MRVLPSGPWQAKQVREKMGRMSRLNRIASSFGTGSPCAWARTHQALREIHTNAAGKARAEARGRFIDSILEVGLGGGEKGNELGPMLVQAAAGFRGLIVGLGSLMGSLWAGKLNLATIGMGVDFILSLGFRDRAPP